MDRHLVVETEWLEAHLEDGPVVVDARPPQFYMQAHIPGAVNIPVFLMMSPSGREPSPSLIAQRLGQAGISRKDSLVAYDDGESAQAASFLWLLAYIDHPGVALLDGGLTKWAKEGRRWETERRLRPPVAYPVPESNSSVLATLDDVRRAIGSADAVIVDTRTAGEYLGFQRTAARNGHIPGAVNIDTADNLIRSIGDVTQLQPEDGLRKLYEGAGVTPEKRVIVHCGSGVRSSQTFAVLKALGYPDVRNYVGGWQEWGNRSDTEVEGR